MKAVVWTGARRMIVEDIFVPEPGPDEVLIQVDSVGICGSELSGYLGHNSLRVPPLVMGHEFSGIVAGKAAGISTVEVGDRIVVNPLITCGKCSMCVRGLDSLCLHRKLIGAHQPGAFADYVLVPAKNCLQLPKGMDLVTGALAEPLACGMRAAKLGGVTPGDRVVVIGAGTIGLFAMTAARRLGGDIILAVEINPGRLAQAAFWGAHQLCNPMESDAAAAARDLTAGLGADVVFDAVGSSNTRRMAIDMARPGGTVVMIGLHEAESLIQANHMIRSEIHLTGAFAYTPSDFAEAVSALASGLITPGPAWLDERPLTDCDASFQELIDTSPAVAKIILHP